jgi:hypothetical protein
MSSPLVTPSPFDLEPAPKAKAAGFWSTWEDALDIFYSPTAVFQRRLDGRYGLALIILIALSIGVYYLSAQVNEAIFDIEFKKSIAAQAAAGRPMSEKDLAAAKQVSEKFASFFVFVLPIFSAVAAWVTGLILRLLGNLMGGRFTYAQATALGVLAGFPEVLNRAAVGAQGLVLDPSTITSKYSFAVSAARFLPDTTNSIVLKCAAIADPFVLWSAFLVGLGAHILGNMEKEKAAVLAIIYTILSSLLAR